MEEDFKEIAAYEGQEITEAVERMLVDPEFLRWLYGTTGRELPAFPRRMIAGLLKRSANPRRTLDRLLVMPFVTRIRKGSMTSLKIYGMDNIETEPHLLHLLKNGATRHGMLFLTNHRDIVLDAALLAYLLFNKTFMRMYIGVGNNLFGKQWIEDLMRSCGCFAVIRDGDMRDAIHHAKVLSNYITDRQRSGYPLWLAQREGRAKDGNDTTQPAILKMLTLASDKSVFDALKELNITPVSISYEYDPCDYLKAREYQLKRDVPGWKKTKREDMDSMQIGITEMKGDVVYQVTHCINDELDVLAQRCADLSRNEQLKLSAEIIDRHIFKGYHLAWTNIAAKDILEGKTNDRFEEYLQKQIDKIVMPDGVEKDVPFLRQRILELYANPAINQEKVLKNKF
ncbi:MAG: 1-acyl-sn-glycerol-3-phosphate acyltransferase [Paludibacteraceae bacterium]|nr:1-acyl-sn-glycerol-3-phosphate acyltransferase [Paludibacteraceae bacterium]